MQVVSKEDLDALVQQASAGDAAAQYQLGEHFRIRAAVDVDLEQAFAWYERAAKQRHLDAQYRVGVMQLQGSGAHKNLESALDWLTQAAEQNHSKSQTRLAWCYQTGTGVPE
ncbi:MAG: tetratricopeptide repeat protein, partial [Gammaproteobacteria bacterium]